MNWIFPLSKGSGSLPPLTSLQQQRQRQIESLKTAHSSLAEIQKDVEYRIPFTVNNTTISINILLPPQFPQEKPAVSVYPRVRHRLVDSHNGTMVTSPLITNAGLNGHTYKMPEIPETFQELSELSTLQLKEMNEQEDVLLQHFVCLPQLKQVTYDKDEMVKNIIEMASFDVGLPVQLSAG
ncbi:UNVERIFIED_CONTAM: hypothetical protein FKN15_076466 [Acipenser sinensis]